MNKPFKILFCTLLIFATSKSFIADTSNYLIITNQFESGDETDGEPAEIEREEEPDVPINFNDEINKSASEDDIRGDSRKDSAEVFEVSTTAPERIVAVKPIYPKSAW